MTLLPKQPSKSIANTAVFPTQVPPSVNYHLTKYCNMKCSFCYATFNDLKTIKHDFARSVKIVTALAEAGFEKITFAGGEPTLVKELPELAKLSKELGLVTTIVTNGTNLNKQSCFEKLIPHLDWVAVSIDSICDHKNLQAGRAINGKDPLSKNDYETLLLKLKANGVKTKINTVVSIFNVEENLSQFINTCKPDRWKVLQALPIEGQNSQNSGKFEISKEEFEAYISRNKNIQDATTVVTENIEMIKGSYIMVSPEGRFFDNTAEGYKYSDDILQSGVNKCLEQVNFDQEKFLQRGGQYNFK